MKAILNKGVINVFFTFLFILSPAVTWESTFYVDKDSLGGKCSDSGSNSGSYTEPWCSITYGVSKLRKGDILYVRRGVYTEVVTIATSGDEHNGIVVAGYAGERPVIDGKYKNPNRGFCTSDKECPLGYKCDKNCGVCGNGICDPVSGNCFTYDSLIRIKGEYITVKNFEVRRSFGHGIQIDPSAGNCIIRDCWVHDNRASGISIYRAKPHHLIDKCKVYNNCNFASYPRAARRLNWPGGIAWRATEYVVVTHCEVYNNWGEGIIMMWAGNAKILSNAVYDNYAVEIYGDAVSKVLVEGNLVYSSGDRTFFRNSSPCAGIYFEDEPKACCNAGIRTNDVKIINNLLANNGTNIIVAGGCKEGQIIESMIANNTSVNPSLRSIKIVGHNGAIPKSKIINNIFCQSNKMRLLVDNKSTIKFSNNIWSRSPTFPCNVSHPPIPGSVSGVKLLMIGDPQLKALNKIATIKPKEKIKSEYFKILLNSPAINTAIKLNDVRKDYFGTERGDYPDIGAVEHTGLR